MDKKEAIKKIKAGTGEKIYKNFIKSENLKGKKLTKISDG